MDEIILGSPAREERDTVTAVHGDGHGDSGHGHGHADNGPEHEVSGHVHELEDSGHGSGVEASGGCVTTRTSEQGYGPPRRRRCPRAPTNQTDLQDRAQEEGGQDGDSSASNCFSDDAAGDRCSQRRVGGLDRGGGDGSGDGRGDQIPEGQEGEGVRSRMSHLWDALSGLRARMKAGMRRQRLEAADGTNTSTPTMSPTRDLREAQQQTLRLTTALRIQLPA